jgi:hypothetical protein
MPMPHSTAAPRLTCGCPTMYSRIVPEQALPVEIFECDDDAPVVTPTFPSACKTHSLFDSVTSESFPRDLASARCIGHFRRLQSFPRDSASAPYVNQSPALRDSASAFCAMSPHFIRLPPG